MRGAALAQSTVSISCVDPTTDPLWRGLLTHPAAGLFHSPPWLRAVTDAYGFPIRAYVASDSRGGSLGGAAFCEIDDSAGHRLVPAPFSDTCDPLITSAEIWPSLFRQLQAHEVPVNLRCVGPPVASIERDLTTAKRARWHRLSLDGPPDEQWRRIREPSRRAIQRARRMGVEIRPISGSEDLAAFHQLHVALRKAKYRLLAQPRQFFEAIERRFCESGGWHSMGAFLGDRMIAATIYLRWGDVLYYKFNASALDALSVRPNNLLVWSGIELARSLGCKFLDLGPSDDDQPGLIRFKRDFGAEETELRFLRWSPPGWRERPSSRPILSEITRQLTEPDVSDDVAARAGEAFYRYFA